MIRIILADDHPIVRAGLRRIIEAAPGMQITGEAANGLEAIELVRTRPCEVLLLDIAMPVMDGLDALKQIKAEGLPARVLVLSAMGEAQYGLRLLKAGAAGFLNKEAAPEELVYAVSMVAAGRRYVGSGLSEHLASRLDEPGRRPHESLSDREFEVFRLVAAGASNAEISSMLHLSPSTVSTYKARIREKTGLDSDAALARYAVENRLL